MRSRYQKKEKKELTLREKEVLELMVRGLTNNEIGDILFITINTVKLHIKSILNKLNAKNRIVASIIAIKGNMLEGIGEDKDKDMNTDKDKDKI